MQIKFVTFLLQTVDVELRKNKYILTNRFSKSFDNKYINIFWSVKFIYSEKTKNFAKFSPYFWLQYTQSKVRGRFRKILWPSQNIWTLTFKIWTKLENMWKSENKVVWLYNYLNGSLGNVIILESWTGIW